MKISKNTTQYLVRLALLTAITVLLSLTYFPIGPISLTFVQIPVVVGAIILGPSAGTFLGFVFGLTSVIAAYRGDPFGATLLNFNQLYTWIVCLVPRIAMGYLTGLIFKGFRQKNRVRLGYFFSSAAGAMLNTLLFGTFLIAFFLNTYFSGAALQAAVGIYVGAVWLQGLCETVVCCLAGAAVCIALSHYDNRSR